MLDDLSRTLNVSRTPIREALRTLTDEGLVSYDGKTYRVREHTVQEIEDLFAIRLSLELLAVKQATQRMTAESIRELLMLCDEWERTILQAEISYLISCDMRFHGLIARGTGNMRLEILLAQLNEQCWWISGSVFSRHPNAYDRTGTLQAHREIARLIGQRDVAGATEWMHRHILDGERRKLLHLRENDASVDSMDRRIDFSTNE